MQICGLSRDGRQDRDPIPKPLADMPATHGNAPSGANADGIPAPTESR